MPETSPNVVLVVTDQHRGDCIGADPQSRTDEEGFPIVSTPGLDGIASSGALFSRAYSPAPKCQPARKCLWSGMTPASAGAATDNACNTEWDFDAPLARVLRDAGYQTHLTGKCHSEPPRNYIGFEGVDLHSGVRGLEAAGLDDYYEWLDDEVGTGADENATGLGKNGTSARPWHLDEAQHPTNWTTDRAIDFLRRRDPTRPFFLTVSYVRPHPPWDPPRAYWEQYNDMDLPDPVCGDWVDDIYGTPSHSSRAMHRSRTGYYGSISHVDAQIQRLVQELSTEGEKANTMFVMTADHGEMLGDHRCWAKSCAYEGAARIPLLLQLPSDWDRDPVGVVDRPVGIHDVMPTILDAADVERPETVEGRSLLDLVAEPTRDDWRSAVHGEFSPEYSVANACQFLVDDDEQKYIWNPVTGTELLFDLTADPYEERNLADDPDYTPDLEACRSRLADRLVDRPEGFVENGSLTTVSRDAWQSL